LHFDFLVQVFQKTVRLIRHGIKPVFVFDGEVNEAKVSGDIAYIFSLSRALSIFHNFCHFLSIDYERNFTKFVKAHVYLIYKTV
jgi:hypothetical protein